MLDHVLAAALALSLQQADGRPRAFVPTAPPPAKDAAPIPGLSADREGMEGVEPYGGEPAPPPGSSAKDRALWHRGIEVTTSAWQVRDEANRLLGKAQSSRVSERLDTAAAASPPDRARKLRDLKADLVSHYEEAAALFNRRWPVDTVRVCGYAHSYYDNALRLPEGDSRVAELGTARAQLEGCAARAEVPTRAMAHANKELAEELAEAEKALAAAQAAGIPTWPEDTRTPAGSTPSPAPSATPAAPAGTPAASPAAQHTHGGGSR